MARLHVLVHGCVQGVGFRMATFRTAHAMGLRGWVRNLEDGSVEAEFDGEDAQLSAMQSWCSEGPRSARVLRLEVLMPTNAPAYTEFRIC